MTASRACVSTRAPLLPAHAPAAELTRACACAAPSHSQLGKAFLVVRGYHGWIGCGYLNPDTASRLGDAAAIFTGVATHDDMLSAEAVSVSAAGEALGLTVGMTGAAALELIRGDPSYKIVPKAPNPPPHTPGFEWDGLTCEHIPLRWPLLVVHGSKGLVRASPLGRCLRAGRAQAHISLD